MILLIATLDAIERLPGVRHLHQDAEAYHNKRSPPVHSFYDYRQDPRNQHVVGWPDKPAGRPKGIGEPLQDWGHIVMEYHGPSSRNVVRERVNNGKGENEKKRPKLSPFDPSYSGTQDCSTRYYGEQDRADAQKAESFIVAPSLGLIPHKV